MQRRQVLRITGSALAVAAGSGVVSADDDADPRPSPMEGSLPNKNVSYTKTGALGEHPFNENSEIPAGDWILHDNGWVLDGDKADAREFANSTNQNYFIDGEEFVFDSFEDWDYNEEDNSLMFEHFTPPKKKGKTYEIRWEFESEVEEFAHWEQFFPQSNQVEIVGRN